MIRKILGIRVETNEGLVWDWCFQDAIWYCIHFPYSNESGIDVQRKCERNYPRHIPTLARLFSREIL